MAPAPWRQRISAAKADAIAAAASWLWDQSKGSAAGRRAALEALGRWPGEAGLISRQLDIAAMAAAGAAARRLSLGDPGGPGTIEALRKRGAAPLAIIGDSHSRLYVQRGADGGRWLAPFHYLATGASARGLSNPDSRSGQGDEVRRFVARLSSLAEPTPTLFVFGQVDVEFVFTFKRLETSPAAAFDPVTFDRFCEETAGRYAEFVARLGMPPGLATLAGVFPPALSDAAWRAGYVNAHIAAEEGVPLDRLVDLLARATIPDLVARTHQHRLFNRHLATAAAERGLAYAEVFEPLLNPRGVIDAAYLGAAAGLDHHLDASAIRRRIVPLLWGLVSNRRHDPQPS